MDDLARLFGELTGAVPDGPPGEVDFIFSREVLPVPPPELATERVFVSKTYHDYNGWYRADALILFVDPVASRELGVFLLACALHDPVEARLELPLASDVRRFVYRSPTRNGAEVPVGLSQRAQTFRYFPSQERKHPWLGEADARTLPLLALSTSDESPLTPSDWEHRDTVFVEGSAAGTVRLAELLLNAGCSWNLVREFDLEGDAGFRGVAPMSAELQIALPDSFRWLAHPVST